MDYVDLYIYHMWDYRTPIGDILQGLGRAVREGKVRYIGISNCLVSQLTEANALAEKENLPRFISVQNHYNLIFREEEKNMSPYCREHHIAVTPYSALASGRLSRHPEGSTKRLQKDNYARLKYDKAREADQPTLSRVAELSDRRGVSMTEISLAWLLTRADAPIVGATRLSQIEEITRATELKLTPE